MPKFYGQNKKRIDPRYFLDETTNRDGDMDNDGDVDIDDVEKVVTAAQKGSSTDGELPAGLQRSPYDGQLEFTPEMLQQIREAFIEAGYDSVNYPGEFFTGKLRNGNDCTGPRGHYNHCDTDTVARGILNIPIIVKYLKRGDVKYNQRIINDLQSKPISLDLERTGTEDIHDVGELVTRYMETMETGQGIDPRAKGLQREPYSPKGGESAYAKMMSKYSQGE